MTDLIVDKEFKELIPPLSDEEFLQLEENILRDGIQDPLKIWNNTLIDGHNRFEIAAKHNLNFTTAEMQFKSRDDVKVWIIKNQFGRRNLSAYDRSILALKLKPVIAAKAKEKQAEYHGNQYESGLSEKSRKVQNFEEPIQKGIRSCYYDGDFLVTDCGDHFEAIKERKPLRENRTDSQIAKIAGVSDNTIRKVEKIEESAPEEVKEKVKSGDMSINEAYRRTKESERKEEIQKQVEEIEQKAIEKPDGLFDVIVIDPAWNYESKFVANGRRCANPYPQMTQEELKKIEIPAAENCIMFLWTTHQFIWDAKELLDTWGFNYRCMLVWNKQQIGMGNLIRMQCEFCLIGLKGKPIFKDVHDLRDLIEEPRREHSRKPDAFYKLVDSLCVGRKLDYFSREHREGWENYGNDTTKFNVA